MFLTVELSEFPTVVKIIDTHDDLVLKGTIILELACEVLLFDDFDGFLKLNGL